MNTNFISRQTANQLNCQIIIDELLPFSEPGKALFLNLKPYTVNCFTKAVKNFNLLSKYMAFFSKNKAIFEDIKLFLAHIKNISSTLKRLEQKQILETFEIFEIKSFVYFYNKLVSKLKSDIFICDDLQNVFKYLDQEKQNTPSFYLSNNYNPALKVLRNEIAENSNKIRQSKTNLLNKINNELNHEFTETFSINRLNNELLEKVKNSKYFYIKEENFANIIFSLKATDEILDLKQKNSIALENISKAEEQARANISKFLHSNFEKISNAYNFVAKFDWNFAKVLFALKFDCCIPNLSQKPVFKAEQAINIPLKLKNKYCQALDFDFSQNLNIITGANMAGKSTILHTIGQFTFLVAYGICVPAKAATLCLSDFIFTSYNGLGNLDLSSFGAEVVSISNALKRKGQGLFLLDEFARGTNPEEGEAFSAAVLNAFSKKPCLVIAATHFTKPSQLKTASHFRVKGISDFNYLTFTDKENLTNRLDKLKQALDYSLIKVKTNSPLPHQAIEIAKILGADKEIIENAIKLLNN